MFKGFSLHLGVFLTLTMGSVLLSETVACASDEPPKLVSLGLSAATAMTSQKDVVKGLKQAAADEYTDWLWQAVGGTEKLMTGNAEAEIPVVKDKIMKIVSTVQAIEKVSIAMTEGKYDDAAVAAIDEVVGKLNHPLVTVTWEMAKLTYESHKLVLSTGAERDIEAMYGIVANDRRIMGLIDPQSDSPAQIQVNAQTADYFFNKYIVTDGSARGLMKSYVTTHLGEEWPEESWSAYLKSWGSVGSGVDTKKNAEIEMLAGEWRNKARGWVVHLLQEANKQAKVFWAQARLRQQMAAFKMFSDRVGHFYNNDLDRMLQEFLAIKANKEAEAELANLPTASQKAYQELQPKIAKMVDKDLKNVSQWDKQINDWQLTCLSAASKMESVNKSLSVTIYAERKNWLALANELSKKFNEKKGQESRGVIEEFVTEEKQQAGPHETLQRMYDHVGELYAQYFEGLFVAFDWTAVSSEVDVFDINRKSKKITLTGNPDTIVERAVEQLNSGDFKGADRIIEFWNNDYSNNEDWHNDVKEALWKHNSDIQKKIKERLAGALPGFINEAWERKKLKTMSSETLARVMASYNMQYKDVKDSLLEVSRSFKDLALALRQKVDQYSSECATILNLLPTPAALAGNSWLMEDAIKEINESGYTHMVSPKSSGPIKVKWMTQFVGSMVPGMNDRRIVNSLLFTASEIEKRSIGWSEGEKIFKNLTLLSPQEIQQYRVLVEPSFAPDKALENIKAAIAYANILRKAPEKLKAAAKKAEADQLNREIDSDFVHAKTTVIEAFFRELQEQGLIKLGREDYELVLPKSGRSGMIRIEEPFPHYATREELPNFGKPLRDAWGKMSAASFAQTNAPAHVAKWKEIMNAVDIPAAKEENFIAPNYDLPIYKSDLQKALGWVASLKGSDERYMATMAEVAKLVPGLMQVPTVVDQENETSQAKLYGMTLEEFNTKMGKAPVKIQNYRIDRRADAAIKSGTLEHDLGKIYAKIGKRVEELHAQKVDHQAALKTEEAQAQAKAEQEEQRKKALAENQAAFAQMGSGQLAGYYGYGIKDARLNSISLRNASGEVILTRGDLPNGEMILHSRLLSIEKMQTLLISEDGGRTWHELPVSLDISYKLNALPGKVYDFVLKVKTTDLKDIEMKVFPGVNSITYQDMDTTQFVAETIKKIADAYERKDVSSFSDSVSRDYLGNKTALENGVRFDFDFFDAVRLSIHISSISKRGGMFVAETKWDKVQSVRTTGQEQRTSGKTTFMFVLEDGKMKIKSLRGDLIYATLSPEIAQASGKSAKIVEQIRIAQQARNPIQPGADTTENAGGVTSTSILAVETVSIRSGQSIDFEAGPHPIDGMSGDIYFEGNIFNPSGSAEIDRRGSGLVEFNALATVPGDFANDWGSDADGGEVYIILTGQGNYLKMFIQSSIGIPADQFQRDFVIKYAISPDRSRNLATQ